MKFWDITPRKRHRPKITPSEKKEKKRSRTWLFFIILIGAFFIAFFGASKTAPNLEKKPSPAATTTTPSDETTFKTQKNISIKVLNGTGRVEETSAIKNALQDSGFQVSATENALNLYNETIVYYQAEYKSYAENIRQVLKDYNPQISEFTSETKYDIVIVIGNQ
jgi:hypothetical protein